jgi:predicted transcriptional regulator
MSDKKRDLDLDVLDAIIAHPGQSLTSLIEQFSEKASKNTIRKYVADLANLGRITARKETVLRPTDAGERFLEKCRKAHPRED